MFHVYVNVKAYTEYQVGAGQIVMRDHEYHQPPIPEGGHVRKTAPRGISSRISPLYRVTSIERQQIHNEHIRRNELLYSRVFLQAPRLDPPHTPLPLDNPNTRLD